ncbi:MAG: hypothetical protein ED556_03560 [Winogradskyella sp.]|nr:MAG: hypothetical protein ED556_03560 [Winogradskyella sp.]
MVSFSFSQNYPNQIIKDSTSISGIVSLNEAIDFDGVEVKFKEVIKDSRCPKTVMCVRAGEAEIIVSIFKNGEFIKDQRVIIDASGLVVEKNNLVLKSEDYEIYGFSLSPYPTSPKEISGELYSLELVYRSIVER